MSTGIASTISEEIDEIELTSNSSKKFDKLLPLLSQLLNVDDSEIHVTSADKPGNIPGRLMNGKHRHRHYEICVVIVSTDRAKIAKQVEKAKSYIHYQFAGYFNAILFITKSIEDSLWHISDVITNENGLCFAERIKSEYENTIVVKTQNVELNSMKSEAGMDVNLLNKPRQLITYGAPGTGKSHEIACLIRNEAVLECFRTTFHPDSDYSTFVGAYKPVMEGSSIAYKFRPQAFMNAYVKAWREMAEAKKEEREAKNVVLVIEEINRGNCAQIFGDLFQLLDRGNSGYSCYPIDADTDLAEWLKDEKQLGDKLEVLEMPPDIEEKEWKKVKNLKNLALPPNLYIWATMNTSDQSLFPIDSAFKRRWDWKYVPISKPDKKDEPNWKERKIEVGGELFDWWDFIRLMNKYIKGATESEDKQLGYFFVKADDATGYISADTFANKVLFYLYGDAFKSFPLPDCFEKPNKELLTFGEFFYREKVEENGKTTHKPGDVKLDVLERFLKGIQIEENKIGVISKKQGEDKKESDASESVKDSSATKEQPELFNQ